MKRLVGLVLILLCILACGIGLYVSAANRDVVVIDLLFWPAVPVRTGLLIVLAFAAGACAGLLAGTAAGVGGRVARDVRLASRHPPA